MQYTKSAENIHRQSGTGELSSKSNLRILLNANMLQIYADSE